MALVDDDNESSSEVLDEGEDDGDLAHILLHCPALAEARHRAISHWSRYLVPRPWLLPVVAHHTLSGQSLHLQFLLDLSVLPMVISSKKCHPDLLQSCFYLSRTWIFTMQG